MNHIVITTLLDLQSIINEPLNVSEKQSSTNFPNMWALTFDDDVIKSIRLEDLKKFFIDLLRNWSLQLFKMDPRLQAKFYLWFDQQASQLRFNLIFDIDSPLPFGCKLDITHSLEPLLNDFLTVTHQLATQRQDIEFFDPAADLEDDDDTDSYVLKVYVKILQE